MDFSRIKLQLGKNLKTLNLIKWCFRNSNLGKWNQKIKIKKNKQNLELNLFKVEMRAGL